MEHAKHARKAFFGCLTSSAYSAGLILAGLIASFLTASFMPAWAWRFGFALALIAGILIFYLRIHVTETPEYQLVAKQKQIRLPLLAAMKKAPYAVIGVIGIAWLVGIMTFGTYVFMATYLHSYFDMSLSLATLIITFALLVDASLEPFLAILADRVGLLWIIKLGMVGTMLFSIPAFYLISTANVGLVILGMILLSILIALTYAPLNAYMVSLFPPQYRYSGFGVSFNIGISLFGGTTPLFMMWLVNETNNFIAPAWYYVFGALIGLVSISICEYGRYKASDMQTSLNS